MITVRYSCPPCGVKDESCQVPARNTADESLRDWMNRVGSILAADHRSLHPDCRETSLKDIKLPNPEGQEFVGQQME